MDADIWGLQTQTVYEVISTVLHVQYVLQKGEFFSDDRKDRDKNRGRKVVQRNHDHNQGFGTLSWQLLLYNFHTLRIHLKDQ